MSIPCKMRPVGFTSLPLGYIRLDFLESTGTQWVLTDIYVSNRSILQSTFESTAAGCVVGATVAGASTSSAIQIFADYDYFKIRIRSAVVSWEYFLGKKYSATLNIPEATGLFDGEVKQISGANLNFEPRFLSVFSRNGGVYPMTGKIYYVKTYTKDNTESYLIPTLPPTGIPCMFDLVSKTPFYNAGTGAFIAGLTMKQALSLANLPATTNGTLTVSLPWEAEWDAKVRNALDKAAEKGWIITVQYRDPEATTANIPISFLESTGDANILLQFSSIETGGSLSVLQDTQFLSSARTLVGFIGNAALYWGCQSGSLELGNNYVLPITPGSRNSISFETAFVGSRMLKAVLKTGDNSIERETSPSSYPENWQYGIFALAETAGYRNSTRVWSCSGIQDELYYNLIPALSPTGIPCMYDSVSRQNFYNSGTGAFIAGFDTAEQARKLAYLPDVTAGTDATKKSLTVSIPLEVVLDPSVQSALDVAAAKGWTIIVQHRESEIATANLEADFLESTGTQYIDTGIKSTPTSKWEVDYQSKKTPGTVFESVFGARSRIVGTSTSNNTLSAIVISNMTAARFVVARMTPNGAVGIRDQDILFSNDFPATARYIYGIDVEDYIAYVDDKIIEGNSVDGLHTDYSVFVLARNDNGSVSNISTGKLYGIRVSEAGSLIQSQVPALSTTGTPCMHDTVTGQNFYNQGTGSFVVGFDTTEKAAISLSKLPVTTNGTLTVSLPAEAQNASTLVPAAIDIAKGRGWTIITQYRTN